MFLNLFIHFGAKRPLRSLRLLRLLRLVDFFPSTIVEPYLTVTCTFLNQRNHRRVALVSPGRLIPLGNTVWRRSLSTERPGKAARDLILSVSPRVLPHLAGLRARVS